MTRSRRGPLAALALVGLASWSCVESGVGAPAGRGVWNWPAEPPAHELRVTVDTLPARTALECLASATADPALVEAALASARSSGALRVLGLDEAAYRTLLEKGREHDGASPWSRLDAKKLLGAVEAIEGEKRHVAGDVARRVGRLLPVTPRVDVGWQLVLVLGLPSSSPSLAFPPELGDGLAVDVARSFTELEENSPAALADQLVQRVGPELFSLGRDRQAPSTPLAADAPRLVRIVARLQQQGPLRYLAFSESFLPITRWLQQPLGEVWNRFATRVDHPPAAGEPDPLDERAGTPFWDADVALVGATMVDAIVVVLGPARCREAIAAGPAAFAAAYEEAASRDRNLRRLPSRLIDAVAAPPAAGK